VIGRGTGPRWRRRTASLTALLLGLLVAACNTAGASNTTVTLVPVVGGSLAVGIDRAPTGCNPNTLDGDTWADRFVLGTVLPGAFSVDSNGEAMGNQPFIAQAELVSTNPQTIVYTIDPKAVWSDGVPITAADFRYAWEQQRGTDLTTGLPTTVNASTLGYRDIKSLTSSNNGKTVTVVFKEPFADWQMLFDYLLPAHVMEKVGWDPACASLNPSIDLSGGPYELASVGTGRIVLRVNPRWWGTPPLLSKVTIRIASGPSQLAQWFRRGTAQVVLPASVTPSFAQAVVNDPRSFSELDVSSAFVQLEFAVNGPNTDTAVLRDAIAHAIDRQELIADLVGPIDANIVVAQSHLYVQNQNAYPTAPDLTNALNTFIGSNEPSTTTTTNPTPGSGVPFSTQADLDTTDHELIESGYVPTGTGQWSTPLGTPLVLHLAIDAGDPWAYESGLDIVDQLQRAGFIVQVSGEPNATATGLALSSGAADLAVLPLDTSPYPSQAVAWYTPSLGSPGQNGSQDWSNLDDPTVNSLVTQAERQLNPVKAQPIYAQVDQQLWTDMVGLPLFAEPGVLGWSVHTYGVTPNFHGPNLLVSLSTWQLRLPVSTASPSASESSTSSTSSG
jgi:peptide/nickel transport system substrate-binding protein